MLNVVNAVFATWTGLGRPLNVRTVSVAGARSVPKPQKKRQRIPENNTEFCFFERKNAFCLGMIALAAGTMVNLQLFKKQGIKQMFLVEDHQTQGLLES